MKVVLTQEVRGLGGPGDLVDVADGYARNFLFPRRFGIPASKGAMKQVEEIRRTRELREIRDREKAEEMGRVLAGLDIKIPAKSGSGGRLFGQVTSEAVAAAIVRAGGPKIDRKRLHFDGPVKSLGAHPVRLRLHPEVEAEFRVEIVPG